MSDTSVSISITPTTATFRTKVTNAVGTMKYHWTMSTDNWATSKELPWTTIGTYTFAPDSSSVTVSNIDTLMTGYQYRVDVTDKSTTCSSTYSTVKLTVTNGPAVGFVATKPSCAKEKDGKLAIHISGGEPNETYSITFTGPSGANIPNPNPLTYVAGPTAVADVVLTGPAGAYDVELKPVSGPYLGLPTQTKHFSIEPQIPVSVTLVSDNDQVCAGNNINLTADLTGGPEGGAKTYQWYESTDDGVSYTQRGETSSSISIPLTKSSVFRVTGMVGTCDTTSNTVAVAALPTPTASIVAATDTGCYSFDLHNLQVVETTGISDYTVTLHSAAPKGINDNRYLIPESDYIVTKDMTVYARLTVGGLCSSTASGSVYIKKMDQCYPIAVPEFFSPDGDGVNDLFQIDNLQAYDNPEIVVYDRYGKQVFKGGKEALTPPNGWDGKYISKDLPSGDYWYEMKFKEIKTKVGHFS
ncbi:MAG: T9SS type B sorting domain-containing protein, partial [Flavipsychrobacter sp.]|nr:T9SS type B sorting domain-containing protein [Flavipsychrobacter sp.]